MNERLDALILLLGPILLAYFVASRLGKSSRATARRVAPALELVASILLPLVVLGVVRRTDITGSLWISLLIGFVLPIFLYVTLYAVARFRAVSPVFAVEGKINRLLLSSFGGGNRGTLLILTAFGAQAAIGPDVIKHFVVLDLGNLLCLLSLGFLLLGRRQERSRGTYLSEALGNIVKNPGVYVVALIALQLPALRETGIANFISAFDGLLDATRTFLGSLFSFCIFLAIFIRIEKLSDVMTDFRSVILAFLATRATGALVFVALLVVLGSPLELILALAILAFMPPSSFLWTRIATEYPVMPENSKRESVYLVPNFFYLGMLALALLWGMLA